MQNCKAPVQRCPYTADQCPVESCAIKLILMSKFILFYWFWDYFCIYFLFFFFIYPSLLYSALIWYMHTTWATTGRNRQHTKARRCAASSSSIFLFDYSHRQATRLFLSNEQCDLAHPPSAAAPSSSLLWVNFLPLRFLYFFSVKKVPIHLNTNADQLRWNGAWRHSPAASACEPLSALSHSYAADDAAAARLALRRSPCISDTGP